MANEIYHRSNWGNAVNDKYWADVYEKYSATNKMYIRSDYYENSNETDKLMADIYPKPSILLTPTAYDNGSLHSVKPVDVLGSEEITNGNFSDGSTGWDIESTWTIANNMANGNGANGSSEELTTVNQLPIGTYKIVFEVKNYVSGSVRAFFEGSIGTDISANGIYTIYRTTTANRFFKFRGTNFYGSVDNVSVKELTDADFDFTRGSSATRVNEKGLIEDVQILSGNLVQNGDFSELGSDVVLNGNFDNGSTNWTLIGDVSINNGVCTFFDTGSNANSRLIQSSITANKTYKLVFRVTRYVEGGIQVIFGGASAKNLDISSGVGTYTMYLTAGGSTQWEIKRWGLFPNFDFDIDNVSIKEVGQNWTFGTGWSVDQANSRADATDAPFGSQLIDSTTLVASKKYKISFDITNYVKGIVRIAVGNVFSNEVSSNGNFTFILTTANTNAFKFQIRGGGSGTTLSVSNISVIEITEDTDLPRINYTNGEGSLLLEGQSTNLLPYSEDFTQWNIARATLTSEVGQSIISGNTNINKLQDSTDNNTHIVYYTYGSFNTSETYTFSAFLKKGSLDYGFLAWENNDARTCIFNLNLGTIHSQGSSILDAEIKLISNNWYKCSITFSNPASSELLRIGTSNGNRIYTGSGNDYIYFEAAQLEELSYATSYIPTNGSTVTRLADVCNNAGSSDLINSTEGVLYAEGYFQQTGSVNGLFAISDGSFNNLLMVRFGPIHKLQVEGTGGVNIIEPNTRASGTYKIAAKYDSNGVQLWVDGYKIVETSTQTTMSGVNQLMVGKSPYGNIVGYKNKCVAVFKEELSDTELQKLTTI